MLTKDHTEEFVNTGARFISLIHSSGTESVMQHQDFPGSTHALGSTAIVKAMEPFVLGPMASFRILGSQLVYRPPEFTLRHCASLFFCPSNQIP